MVVHCRLVDVSGYQPFGFLILGTLCTKRASPAVAWVGFVGVIAFSCGGAVNEWLSHWAGVTVLVRIVFKVSLSQAVLSFGRAAITKHTHNLSASQTFCDRGRKIAGIQPDKLTTAQ